MRLRSNHGKGGRQLEGSPPPGVVGETVRWSRTGRRILKLIVAVVVLSVVIPMLTLPIFERTRDARYEVVSLEQDYWVHRDGRFDVSFQQRYRTGFLCSYYDYAVVTLVEREGLPGGTYRVTFQYPTYQGTPVTVTLGPGETETITSDEVCATSPGENVITPSLVASPPRVYETFTGVTGNNTDWELKGTLTLRELEGVGGEYVVNFRVSPGSESKTVRGQVFASAVEEFDVSFEVPNGTCCSIGYSTNAPKVREKASLITILLG